jgi:hypothetical protein
VLFRLVALSANGLQLPMSSNSKCCAHRLAMSFVSYVMQESVRQCSLQQQRWLSYVREWGSGLLVNTMGRDPGLGQMVKTWSSASTKKMLYA